MSAVAEERPAPASGGSDGTKTPTYESYMAQTGLPIIRDKGVASLEQLDLGSASDGHRSAFVVLDGMEGLSSMELLDLPAGEATTPARHLYEEYVLALGGEGTVEFTSGGKKVQFTWRKGSVFAIPLNMTFSIRNTSSTTARLVMVNNAQLWMDLIGDYDVVFSSDLTFADREERVLLAKEGDENIALLGKRMAFTGPVFHGVDRDNLPEHEFIRGKGYGYLLLNLSGGVFGCHVGELPAGTISNAHWHMGGAVLITVKGEGYTQAWPATSGPQPPEEEIERYDFEYSGAVSAGTAWFHLHANTGTTPMRQIAFRYGGGAGATFANVQGINYRPGRIVDTPDLASSILEEYRAEITRRGIPLAR